MLLSIIIPVYNGALFIEQAITSTEFISNNDVEVVVVDDCSSDNTKEICEKFFRYNNFKYIKHKRNRGVSAARNTGITASSSPYISFLDCDDVLINGTAEKWLKELSRRDYDLHVWGCEEINNSCVKRFNTTTSSSFDRIGFINHMFIYDWKKQVRYGVVWGKIYKRDVIKNAGLFNEGQNLGEDTFFNIDYYNYMNSVYIHNEPSYRHFSRDNSLSTQLTDEYPLLQKHAYNMYRKLFIANGRSGCSLFLMWKFLQAKKRSVVYRIRRKAKR